MVVQIIGVFVIIICTISFFFKRKKDFLLCLISYNVLVCIQYLLQNCVTELIVTIISIFVSTLFYFYDIKNKKSNLIIIIILETVYLLIGILTFQNWYSIFVIISSMIGLFAQWQNNMFVLRLSYICCSVLLIINYLLTGLYTTIIAEGISLVSAVISIFKINILKSNTKDKMIFNNKKSSNYKNR